MPNAVHETGTTAPTLSVTRFEPDPRHSDEPACASNAAKEPASDSQPPGHETYAELAHTNRVAILGQLSASIAHEVVQPIGATITAAEAALRWLGNQPPDLGEARQMLARIVQEGTRAGDIVHRIRAFVKKAPFRRERLDVNEVIREAIKMICREAVKNGVSVQTKLAEHLPAIEGDQVQLQQLMLNLIVNAVEAMSAQAAGTRDLLIQSAETRSGGVLVAVRDSGPGVDPANLERIFDAFFSTKADGLGMGLSICRAIVHAHGGRLAATSSSVRGTTLRFTLPAAIDNAS
jgi:C4-dicarboxylate-specific signal transduction histidine kinase